ncbi:MAG: hypothetical protein KGD58_12545 [Candidatus Lokiarchaeota archaeon]|nr:hypothetical protein [Candidatus Lokiarchaeota archaeon]
MPDSTPKDLRYAEKLRREGKLHEALKVVNEIEKKETLTPSDSFSEKWDFDDLFSSFMSAFNTFSGEIFSKSIDRIKIDENVILMKPIKTFLLCYVIKGQSYPAQQKLTQFSDAIKSDPEIWKALEKSVLTNEVLEVNKPSSLGFIINEIFS